MDLAGHLGTGSALAGDMLNECQPEWPHGQSGHSHWRATERFIEIRMPWTLDSNSAGPDLLG